MKNCTRFNLIAPTRNFPNHSSVKARPVYVLPKLILVIVSILFFTKLTAQTVNTHLYLSDPSLSLDRVDPVATADATTSSSYTLYGTAPSVMVDAVSTKLQNTGPITLAHTTGSDNNRLMLVGISQKNRLITSVTYGGVALTLVGENVTSGNARVSIYQMINPPSGTANVVVTFSANPDKGAVVGVTTFYNVDQATPLGTFVSATGNSTTPSVVASSASNELVYDVVTKRNQAITVGAGQTQRYNIDSGWEIYGGASTETGAVSTTMSWTGSSSDWCIGAVPVKPVTTNYNAITFTQSTPLCDELTIKASNTITISAYVGSLVGSLTGSPSVTAQLKYGNNNIITLNSPSYNAGTGIITWTGSLGSDLTIPGGESISLSVTNNHAAASFKIDFDSQTKPSKITIPVPASQMINISAFTPYSAAYPGGSPVTSGIAGTTTYLRCTASSPFGPADFTSVSFTITPTGSSFAGTSVNSSGCSRTFEYVWAVPGSSTNYTLRAIAKQGYENTLSDTAFSTYDACVACPPTAVNNTASGSGGNPVVVDVLANDYDPNNNIKVNTLSIITQGNNGVGYLNNNKIVYLPNGSYSGYDTITYQICDSTGLCATAKIYIQIDPAVVDPCSDATRSQIYYMPFSENEARIALDSSTVIGFPSNNIRTVISIRVPYAGMTLTWDHWEDGYETNILNPVQTTTIVWGDGNPFNGIAPGYPSDILPNNGSIVLDNTVPTNPRVPANIFYDGRDKLYSSGQIAVTQVCGEPSIISVQCMKTNVYGSADFGTSFTVPVGQNYPSQDFRYTSLFIRASTNNTTINIDKDNDGTLETTATLNEGEIYHVNGSVMSGATVTSSAPVGCDLHFGGNDWYSSRDIPIFPASWYSNTYYSPVPTTSTTTPRDTSVVMLYNSLNRTLNINWSSGIPSSGTISIPAKSVYRFALPYSTTAGFKFVNPAGESFTAIEIVDSYTPGGGGNTGSEFDWAFNLISDARLTDFTTIAWAPGSTDGTRNDNPIWVTPTANTTIYVKYDGNLTSGALTSPCGFKYDASYALNALNHKRLLDPSGDNDQSGMAVYTCDGVRLAAVYGEDPSTATVANPSWDVGSTLQPFCKGKLLFANDDYYPTLINQPVTTVPLLNDFGFLATIDPATVTTVGLLQPSHGTVTVNPNGTILYNPNNGYVGNDTFEYQVCSTPSPIVCDIAKVYITISSCPANTNNNILTGQVFIDYDKDGLNDDGGEGYLGRKVYLYVDGNCTGAIDNFELMDSITVDSSGYYQFVRNPQKIISDNFDDVGGTRSCANGTDGNTPWATNWVDAGDPSVGFCNTGSSAANTDAEIMKDGTNSYGLRLKDNNVSATRTYNLNGATKAFLTFSYRRKSTTLASGEDVYVQASPDGTTFTTIFTITGNGTADASYVTVYNQDLMAYASTTTYLRFLTNNSVDDADTVYIDDIKIQFLKYNQCYITKLDPNSVPAYEYITTASQRTVTFTSAATCNSLMDYGIAKISISVSGTLYNDANALVDATINGSPIGSPGGATVYAYLVDTLGKVMFKSTVNGSGNFNFPLANVATPYTLRLSTVDVTTLSDAPAAASLPADWICVGDSYGTNNDAGSNTESGTPDSAVPVTTGTLSISNIYFGIERLPDSDNKYASVNHPQVGDYITLNGVGLNPPVLSGSDPEDSPAGCLMTGKTVIIDTIPGNAELYYNGVLVTMGYQITNFNANLFQAKVTDATVGDSSINFRYSYVDLAAKKDPTPAIYEIIWAWVLPANGLTATATLDGNMATVKWSTVSESHTNYFEVERSIDNTSFVKVGNPVSAAGTSDELKQYQLPDDISSLLTLPIIYYRVKLADLDGNIKYSNVVAVKLNKAIGITAWPNPFNSKISVSVKSTHNTVLDLQLTDAMGRIIYTGTKPVPLGNAQINIERLSGLPKGFYLLRITDQGTKEQTSYKLIKE